VPLLVGVQTSLEEANQEVTTQFCGQKDPVVDAFALDQDKVDAWVETLQV
jgi:hypothetical protein